MVNEVIADPLAVANELRPVLLRLSRELRKETEQLGVTSRQVTLLWLIRLNPGLSLRELAAEEGISAPALSGYVDRLEKAGLLERVRDESDRRRVGLALTSEGDRLLKRVRARRTTWLAERLRGLEEDELEGVTVSRASAQELQARGIDARCLADVASALGEPADAEVRRIEETYGLPHIRDVYRADWACNGRPRRGASTAPSALSVRSNGSSTMCVPTCSCPRSATRPSAWRRTRSACAAASRCSSSSTRSSPIPCACTWTRSTRRSRPRTRCES